MSAREFKGMAFARLYEGVKHDDGARLEVGVGIDRLTAGASARIAVLVVKPDAHAELLRRIEHEIEHVPEEFAVQIIAAGAVCDYAAEALFLQRGKPAFKRLNDLIVRRAVREVEAVYDFERKLVFCHDTPLIMTVSSRYTLEYPVFLPNESA